MSIEQTRTVQVLSAEVADDFSIEVTARDVMTNAVVVVSLSWGEAQAHVDEMLEVIAEATNKQSERPPATAAHAFDVAPAEYPGLDVCRDCREGKHGACNGSALVDRAGDVHEVDCQCPEGGHRGRVFGGRS